MLTINKKAIFYIKNIYLQDLRYLASLKIPNIHIEVILALRFPDNIVVLEALLF